MTWTGTDEDRLNHRTYVRHTATTIWENLPLVLLSGTLFGLTCVPAWLLLATDLLMPAALAGLLVVLPSWSALIAQQADIASGRRTHIHIMLRAFPRFWLRSVTLALIACFQAAVAVLTWPLFIAPDAGLLVLVGFAAAVFGLLLVVVLSLYAFPLIAVYNAGVQAALRNALILASRHITNTLGLLGMGILCALAIRSLSSALLPVLTPIWGMFLVNNCRMVVEEELARE
jgi:uncharacterized membrane protein YesL